MDKIEFTEKLNTGVYDLEFTKLDGAVRKMIATRMMSQIPEDQHPKSGYNEPTTSTNAVPVFDLQVCGWRSVRPDSIISMNMSV